MSQDDQGDGRAERGDRVRLEGVVIEFDPTRGHVTVDGEPLSVGVDEDLHELAIAWVVEHVARPLGRSVRVIVLEVDNTGATASETQLLVEPDGLVSDACTRLVEDGPEDVGGDDQAGAVGRALVTGESARVAPRGRGRGLVVAGGVVAVLVAGAGMALALGDDGQGENDRAESSSVRGSGASAGADVPSGETTDEAPVAFQLVRGEVLQRRPVLRVRVAAGVRVLRVAVAGRSLGKAAARARLVVRRVDVRRPVLDRAVRISVETRSVVLDGLEPGVYVWRVSLPDAETVSGRSRVKAPPAPIPAPAAPAPAPPADSGQSSGQGGSQSDSQGGNSGSGGPGGSSNDDEPSGPVDPADDEPSAPVPG